jgi:hypothetical protein
LILAQKLLALGQLLLHSHNLGRSAQAVGAAQPGACGDQAQRSQSSAPFGRLQHILRNFFTCLLGKIWKINLDIDCFGLQTNNTRSGSASQNRSFFIP